MAGIGRRGRVSRRRRIGSVSVPGEVAGLLAALAFAHAGDGEPLLRWHHSARPILELALCAAGFDPVSAEDAISHLIDEARDVVRGECEILCEPAWMSTVLTRWRIDRHRSNRRAEAALRGFATTAPRCWERPEDAEAREELRAAATTLPAPHTLVVELYLQGLGTAEVRVAVCAACGVGSKQALRKERQAFELMRKALESRSA